MWARFLSFLPGPWMLVDRDQQSIIDASPELEALLECDRTHFIGHSITSLNVTTSEQGWGVKILNRDLIDSPGRYEEVGLRKKDGSTAIVDVHVSHPPRNSPRAMAICLITDRTEQQRLQGELIAKHQELRKAFAELEKQSQDLYEIKKTLESRNRELSVTSAKLSRTTELAAIGEITAELAHQLNNPLAAAVSAARRVSKLVLSSADPKTAATAKLLIDSLERLTTTIAELRRVYITSRPTEGQAELFDLKTQVRSALDLLQQRTEGCNLVIDVPDDLPLILGRPSQIQHVIINLIDNAVEAAGPAGRIQLSACVADGRILFTVSDDGPGIPKPIRAKIFEPFFTTREHGSGLGLAVVRRNLEENGADISVGDSCYGGAEFKIRFPTRK